LILVEAQTGHRADRYIEHACSFARKFGAPRCQKRIRTAVRYARPWGYQARGIAPTWWTARQVHLCAIDRDFKGIAESIYTISIAGRQPRNPRTEEYERPRSIERLNTARCPYSFKIRLPLYPLRLTLRASVPKLDEFTFARMDSDAEKNCSVSKVLNAEITLDAKLL
jgi:hypothetical protein